MGLGLVTDDRSREEGRHYTYERAVRLHGCGASDETKPLKHLTFLSQALVGVSLLAMQTPRNFSYTALSFIAGKPVSLPQKTEVLQKLKKRAWGINPQALKR
jgi:hypothetical protein